MDYEPIEIDVEGELVLLNFKGNSYPVATKRIKGSFTIEFDREVKNKDCFIKYSGQLIGFEMCILQEGITQTIELELIRNHVTLFGGNSASNEDALFYIKTVKRRPHQKLLTVGKK